MWSRADCGVILQECSKVLGDAIKHCVRPRSVIYRQILDHIVQVSQDRVVDELELPCADKWIDREDQRIAGALLEKLCDD